MELLQMHIQPGLTASGQTQRRKLSITLYFSGTGQSDNHVSQSVCSPKYENSDLFYPPQWAPIECHFYLLFSCHIASSAYVSQAVIPKIKKKKTKEILWTWKVVYMTFALRFKPECIPALCVEETIMYWNITEHLPPKASVILTTFYSWLLLILFDVNCCIEKEIKAYGLEKTWWWQNNDWEKMILLGKQIL